ncbi:hypothetical protein D9619_008964 [Psilocybe cf. subviscida]|uniref:Nephrocystin 3-like N-terminal domain-containing protein n=1 Tax=Psilocybe cf. subviscida TaxID=2480587 RepID=A0A8H5BUY6_9AGAR|nr:hypothetical protein D9619_008964 [Psilocybe cf. subviscida]
MNWLKPSLRKVRNRLSRSRSHSTNPSIDERDQGRSAPPTPSPSPLPDRRDNEVTVLPRPTVEPSNNTSTTSNAEASAPPEKPISAADQQSAPHPDYPTLSRVYTKPSPPTQIFARSKYSQQDIGVLHVAYVLQESDELRELICEVRYKDVLEPSVSVAADLVAALDLDPVPNGVSGAISTFLAALNTIDWTTSLPNEALSIVQQSISQIKSAHPRIFIVDQQHRSRFKAITSGVLGMTLPILTILKDASSVIPVPMLQPLIGVVAGFLKAADEASNNFEWMRWLASTAAEFIVRIAVICPQKVDEHWTQVIDNLRLKLSGIVSKATEFSQRKVVSRFLNHGRDKGDIKLMKEELRAAINFFSVEMHIEHKFDLENMSRNIESLLLEQLPRLPEHSLSHDRYFSGSRRDEIQGSLEWVEADQGEHLLWYHGAAGVGKSTYARQLLNHIKDEGMLGAFAYFAIGLDINPKDLVRMMARELADLHPGCRPAVSSAIQNCAGANRGLDEYITHFLVKPISSLSYSGPLVIILDALDEWVHHEEFLTILVGKVHRPHTRALKFIMTSRYSEDLNTTVSKIIGTRVHEMAPVTTDICYQYFQERFKTISWYGNDPGDKEYDKLLRVADGLLIWAATVCTVVSIIRPTKRPRQILDDILESTSSVSRGNRMEELYKIAMTRIFPDDDDEISQLRFNVLRTMTALKEPLPLAEFALLVDLLPEFVKKMCVGLRALQTRGEFDESVVQPAIKLFHASFIDYLGTLEEARADMTRHCISLLGRSQDMSADVGGKLFRPAELYVGKHFVDHLCETSPDLKFQCIQELGSYHIRKWVAWLLAQLMVIGEENGFPAGSRSLLTLSASLLHEHGVIYSPELMSRDETLVAGVVTVFLTMLELVGIIRGEELNTGVEDHVQYKRDVDKWIHAINGVVIGRLQLHRLEDPLLLDGCTQTRRLESAIQLLTGVRAVLSSCPLSIQENHALALELGFEYGGALSDLERALELHRNLQTRLSEKTPGYTTFLNNFAHALHTQFQYDADCSIDVLHTSISLCQQALTHDPYNHYKRATFLDNLGIALHTKYLVEDPEHPAAAIKEIIHCHQEAIKLRSNHPTHMPLLLNNISFAFQSRSQLQKDSLTKDLKQALFCSLRAASAGSLGSLERSTYFTTLGYALRLGLHTKPPTPLHHIVTPESQWLAQFTALTDKQSHAKVHLRTGDIVGSKMMKVRFEELTMLAQRVMGVAIPRRLRNLVILADLTETRLAVQAPILGPLALSLEGLQRFIKVLEPGRIEELVRLAETAKLVELVELVELGLLGVLARDAGFAERGDLRPLALLAKQARHVELAKLAILAKLAEEEGRLEMKEREVRRQAERSKAGQTEQTVQNKELAKRIKELLYVTELDVLSLQSAYRAIVCLPPGAPTRSAITLLEDNVADQEPVRGGALLRLRARPLAALAEIDRQNLMKAAKAFSQPSDSEIEAPSD